MQSDYQRAYHLAQNLLAMISNYQFKEEEEDNEQEPLLADLLLRSLHACQATTPSPQSPFMDHNTTFLF